MRRACLVFLSLTFGKLSHPLTCAIVLLYLQTLLNRSLIRSCSCSGSGRLSRFQTTEWSRVADCSVLLVVLLRGRRRRGLLLGLVELEPLGLGEDGLEPCSS